MIQRPLEKLKTTRNPQVEKKTWKKTLNSKVQRSISNERQDGKEKMDIELSGKNWEEDQDRREEQCCAEEPFSRVIELINSVQTNSRTNLSSSFDTNLSEESKITTNQQQFDKFYGDAYANTLKKNIPNLEGLLSNSNITEALRAKMLDWMLEVVNFFKPNSDLFTFFKALVIMDLFVKNNQRMSKNKLQDSDIHLIGLTSIFIASKYEDNRHIPLQNLLIDACKNKFNSNQVLTMEWEILLSIGFNSSIPTHMECLDAILNSIFDDMNENTSRFYHQIRYLALTLILKSLYFVDSSCIPMDQLALSCAIISIHANFDCEIVHRISAHKDAEELANEKNYLVDLLSNKIASMTRNFCDTNHKKKLLMDYTQVVRKWDQETNLKFKQMGNWDRYFSLEQYNKDVKREKGNFNGIPH
jgi:hypothetical protein